MTSGPRLQKQHRHRDALCSLFWFPENLLNKTQEFISSHLLEEKSQTYLRDRRRGREDVKTPAKLLTTSEDRDFEYYRTPFIYRNVKGHHQVAMTKRSFKIDLLAG